MWQWLHHHVSVDGAPLTSDRFATVVAEEMDRVRREVGEDRFRGGKFTQARDLFVRLSTAPAFEEFLTVPAYDLLEASQ